MSESKVDMTAFDDQNNDTLFSIAPICDVEERAKEEVK